MALSDRWRSEASHSAQKASFLSIWKCWNLFDRFNNFNTFCCYASLTGELYIYQWKKVWQFFTWKKPSYWNSRLSRPNRLLTKYFRRVVKLKETGAEWNVQNSNFYYTIRFLLVALRFEVFQVKIAKLEGMRITQKQLFKKWKHLNFRRNIARNFCLNNIFLILHSTELMNICFRFKTKFI